MKTKYRIHGMKRYIYNYATSSHFIVNITDIEKVQNYFNVGKIDYKLTLFCLKNNRFYTNSSIWIEYIMDPKRQIVIAYATYRYTKHLCKQNTEYMV